MEITKREIVASITIIAVMLLIGVLISGKIDESQMDKNQQYNNAVKINNDTDLFRYSMDTDVGYTFVYGKLKSVDTVSYDELSGNYMYIKKVKERYTMHTGYIHTKHGSHTYHYWTWDKVGSESKKCKEVTFCGIKFSSDKIDLPSSTYKDTIDGGYHIRYRYYVCDNKYTGTIFGYLTDKSIKDKADFYNGMNIKQTVNYLESGIVEIVFWIIWIIVIGLAVFGFYYLDNRWLEK